MTSDRFITEAREGTRRYRSQATAVADGFARVGVEFPAMGEHWVNLQRVMADTLVPARPSVLIYVNVDGVPRLAGVAYTALLLAGEQPPASPAPGFWHEHNGAVDEESLPLGHDEMATAGASLGAHDESPRLSILHAWIWIPNPDGVFVTNNWSLTFARLGVAAPNAISRDAVHALALAFDQEDYHLLMLRTALGLSASEEGSAIGVLAAQRARAAREVAAVRDVKRLTTKASDRLTAIWGSLWSELERVLPVRALRLRALRQQI